MKKALLSFIISLNFALLPWRVFAHGTEEHTSEATTVNYLWSYGFFASLLVLAVFLSLFFWDKVKIKNLNMKNKENRKKHQVMSKRKKLYLWASGLVAALAVFFLVMMNMGGEEKVTFQHIHGLGYTSDGEALYVPAHDGLKIHHQKEWGNQTEGEKHDYMGFSMVEDGFYSSGHPAPGSDLANPLGIVKSTNGGETIETLDLYEEIDFHWMTVGYESEDIYVFNPKPNSRMAESGFYYSTDKTATWNQSGLQGLEGQAAALTAHPTKTGTVAIGTDEGVFLSEDYGNGFEQLAIEEPVYAVSFGHQNNLFAAVHSDGKPKLLEIDLDTDEITELSVPGLAEDQILYIQQNPAEEEELVFANANKDIYFSHDRGVTWEESVDEGVAVTP